MVLFLPFLVARNRVMAPLLMSCSFQPAVAAVEPAVISRGPRRSTAIVTTATVPIGVRSSSTAAVVVVIFRNHSCDTTAAVTVHQAGPSHRQPPLSRTRPSRSGSNRTRWRCRCSSCRRGSGSSHRTPLPQLGGARVVSCSSCIGGIIGSGTGDQRYCSLGRISRGGS